ncbi:hypothetical protein TSUD_14520 [Trifolium subterraneum]|uniref:Transcription factor CBF/NF-Y/archaeal histone domain-containing protein n=1 Tax=Trifolium subterraneum TaxID=3900 RepID=A0A2Z6MQL5_TRISU|nr:hypothetical protein TSUD_14520 [Trifolium subterraneum]
MSLILKLSNICSQHGTRKFIFPWKMRQESCGTRVLPSDAKIIKDAKKSIQLCVSEFMDISTNEANERCKFEHRKIITIGHKYVI